MALIPSSRYPAQTDLTAPYPQGKARNAGSFQDGTGTPLEADWVNDLWGLLQGLLAHAGITPSGSPDDADTSQYRDAIAYLADEASERLMLGSWTNFPSVLTSGRFCCWAPTQSLFVTCGDAGAIFTSPDASVFTARASGTANGLLEVAAHSSLGIVAVGGSGTIVRSANGTTWSVATSGVATQLNGISSHGALWIAVGDSGVILTSPDAVTWTPRTSGVALTLIDVASNGSIAVAVGNTGTILSSPDGIIWTPRTGGGTATLGSIVWNGEVFVTGGTAGTLITSPDGITWTPAAVIPTGAIFGFGVTTNYTAALTSTGELFVARDASTLWKKVEHGIGSAFGKRALAWNGSVALTVGDGLNACRSAIRAPI